MDNESGWDHPGVSDELGKGDELKSHRSLGHEPSDEEIFEDVLEALSQNEKADASNISVNVRDGIVSLTGKVESRNIKRLFGNLVKPIAGVLEVRNELMIIKSVSGLKGPDSSLKKDLGII